MALFVCVYPWSALFLMEPQIKRRKRKMTEAQEHLSGGAFRVQKRQRENEHSELNVCSVTNLRLKCNGKNNRKNKMCKGKQEK